MDFPLNYRKVKKLRAEFRVENSQSYGQIKSFLEVGPIKNRPPEPEAY